MRRAADLAELGAGTALPNPVVGCVLLAAGGWTVGEGYHRRAGGPHAEVAAIAAAGEWARGSTAVVTLEPCNHNGRTGPCSEALIAAGVARVVVAVRDPWATAAGGIERLRQAGVDVVEAALDTAAEAVEAVQAAEDVNRVWLTAVRRQRPFVSWKVGMTIDGRVAADDGTSRWITSTESRADVHALRSRVDTMIVGVGTVLADDPQLTVRDANGVVCGPQPLRVVIDSRRRTPRCRKGSRQRRRDLAGHGRRCRVRDGRESRPAGRVAPAPAKRTAARSAGGRAHPGGRFPGCRAGRRGARLHRTDPARRRPIRTRRAARSEP